MTLHFCSLAGHPPAPCTLHPKPTSTLHLKPTCTLHPKPPCTLQPCKPTCTRANSWLVRSTSVGRPGGSLLGGTKPRLKLTMPVSLGFTRLARASRKSYRQVRERGVEGRGSGVGGGAEGHSFTHHNKNVGSRGDRARCQEQGGGQRVGSGVEGQGKTCQMACLQEDPQISVCAGQTMWGGGQPGSLGWWVGCVLVPLCMYPMMPPTYVPHDAPYANTLYSA